MAIFYFVFKHIIKMVYHREDLRIEISLNGKFVENSHVSASRDSLTGKKVLKECSLMTMRCSVGHLMSDSFQ